MPKTQPKRAQLAVKVALSANKTPPTEFRIFAAGENDTTKGVFLFDATAAASVMKAAADYGNRLAIDYCHAMLDPGQADPAEAGKAAGWFTLELRGGELWAANVEWTPLAAQKLSDKEFVYISPAFDYDDANRPTQLINIALTNIPAMKDLPPLMAHRVTDRRSRAALDSLSFSNINEALNAALREKYPPPVNGYQSGPYLVDVYDDRAIFDLESHTYQVAYSLSGAKAVLTSEPVEVLRTYTPVPGGRPMEEMMKKLAKALGLSETATADEIMAAAEKLSAPAATAPTKCTKCTAAMPAGSKFCAQCGEKATEGVDDGDGDEVPPAVKAALSRQTDENKKLRAELDRVQAAQELGAFITEASGYKALSQDPKVLGPALQKLARACPAEKKIIDGILQKANAALSASDLLKNAGRNTPTEGSARAELDSKIDAFMKTEAGRSLSRAQASSRVLKQEPALYSRIRAEEAQPA